MKQKKTVRKNLREFQSGFCNAADGRGVRSFRGGRIVKAWAHA